MTFQKLNDTQRSLVEEYKTKGASHKELANIRAKLMRGHTHDNGLFTSPKGETFKFTMESAVAKPKAKPKAKQQEPPAPIEPATKPKAKPKAKQQEPAPIEPAPAPKAKAKTKAKEAPPAPANNLVVEFSN